MGELCYDIGDLVNKIAQTEDRGETLRLVDEISFKIAPENWEKNIAPGLLDPD